MIEVRRTQVFSDWLNDLRDRSAMARIAARIDRLALGNPGETRALGEEVSEMKIDHGQGYRVYFTRRDRTVFILPCGGDKSSQSRDIKRAKAMAKEV